MPEEEKKEEKQEGKPEEKKEEKQEETKDWDKEKQRADQAEANYQKLVSDKDAIQEQHLEAERKLVGLEEQLAEKAEQKEAELAKMDTDLVDRNVIANFEKVQGDLKATKKEISELQKKAKEYTEAEAARQADVEQDERREAILVKLDTKYSPKFRNEALKLATNVVAKDPSQTPKDSLEAYLMLDGYYKQLSDKATEDETAKKKVPVDTGSGGFVFGKENLEEGTFDDVVGSMKKEGKFKGLTFPIP